jgi:hypothetical protein
MKLLLDEDTASATLSARLMAAGYEVVQVPAGTVDAEVFWSDWNFRGNRHWEVGGLFPVCLMMRPGCRRSNCYMGQEGYASLGSRASPHGYCPTRMSRLRSAMRSG